MKRGVLLLLLSAVMCAGDRRISGDRQDRAAAVNHGVDDDDRRNHHHYYHHDEHENRRRYHGDDDDDRQQQRNHRRDNDNRKRHHHHHDTDALDEEDDNRGVHHLADVERISRWKHSHDDQKPLSDRDNEQRNQDYSHHGNDGRTERKGDDRHHGDRQRNNGNQSRSQERGHGAAGQPHRGDRHHDQGRLGMGRDGTVQERPEGRRHQDQERYDNRRYDHEGRNDRDGRHYQQLQQEREHGQRADGGDNETAADGDGQQRSQEAEEQLAGGERLQQTSSAHANEPTDDSPFALEHAEVEAHHEDILPPVAEVDLPTPRSTVAAAEDWEGVDGGPPPHDDVAAMARYIVHVSNWAAMATISTRPPTIGMPFANVFSVADGTRYRSTGVPYMYLTELEISVHDLRANNNASLTMSLAQSDYCAQNDYDPESPLCAHVILSGSVRQLDPADPDLMFARDALFSRHPEMADWPVSHDWFVAQLDIMNVIVLDYFGGAKTVTPAEYFAASPFTVDAGRQTNRL